VKKEIFKCSECEDRKLIASTLERHRGNKAHAAKELGMSWHGLHLKATRLGLLPWRKKAA
jgi:transcriptional regulator with GAF, ATPase, and Fis domain